MTTPVSRNTFLAAHTAPAALSQALADKVKTAARASKSENTLKAYRADWRVFRAWCTAHRATPLPVKPAVLAAFLVDHAETHAVTTVQRRLAAIAFNHRLNKLPSPATTEEVKMVLAGLRRQKGTRPVQKIAVDFEALSVLLGQLDGTTLPDIRNRAIILLGYATALRRENLAALNVSDLKWQRDHLDVVVRREKTDQAGKGRVIGVLPTGNTFCPIRAVKTWIEHAGIKSGPLFRGFADGPRGERLHTERIGPEVIASVVKRAAFHAGLDPADFGGHSLRAGHVTEGLRNGASIPELMRTTGHRRVETLLKYAREVDTVKGSSAASIWPKMKK